MHAIPAVTALARRLYLPPCLDAEDLQQAARVALWKAGTPSGALAGLVARRAAIQAARDAGWVRRRKASAQPDADLSPFSLDLQVWVAEGEPELLHETLPAPGLGWEQRTLLWVLVDSLPEQEREAVTLSAHGWTWEEIAARLGVSRDVVKRRLRSGHARLREMWGER